MPLVAGRRPSNVEAAPFGGAEQTVAFIKRGALESVHHHDIRELVEGITGGLASKAYLDEYLAIYYWDLGHLRYMRDPRKAELVRSPWLLVGKRIQQPWKVADQMVSGHKPSVDCDDFAALVCAQVMAMGGECRVVTVAFRHLFHKGRRQYSHVFAQAREPATGVWITLDPVAADRSRKMMNRAVAAKIWPVA